MVCFISHSLISTNSFTGWFCFNAGSALAANAQSVQSLICTHLSACTAAIVWVLMDYQHTRKWSIIGLCTGAVAGLATITPGSGLVSASSALAFGAIGAFVSNVILRYKHRLGFDDALDVFAVHYIGGLIGLILTGIFAQQWVIALGYPEGTPLDKIPIGGWLDGNWMQVPIQLVAIVSVSAWAFVMTYLILIVLNKIPSLTLRLADEDEVIGTDWAEMGERAYGYLPMDEEHARRQQIIDDARNRLEEEEEEENNGCEIQLDEHINGSIKSNGIPGSIDLTLNTVSGHHVKKRGFKQNLRHLMMSRKDKPKTVFVKGGAHIIEEPVVLNYGQDSKEFGGISKALENISSNYEQKRPAQYTPAEPTGYELDDMTEQRNYHYSSAEEAGPSTTVSSGRNTPVNEYEYGDTIMNFENNKFSKRS